MTFWLIEKGGKTEKKIETSDVMERFFGFFLSKPFYVVQQTQGVSETNKPTLNFFPIIKKKIFCSQEIGSSVEKVISVVLEKGFEAPIGP